MYLQEAYGDCVEFPGDDGKFDIENYVEGHNFTVNGSTTPGRDVGELANPKCTIYSCSSLFNTLIFKVARRIALATLKVARADLNSNGKPTNINYHNLTAHMNLYIEEEACITNIQLKVREEMADNKLVITGANGLVILDQEATRGNPKYFY